MLQQELADRAKRLLEKPERTVVEEPVSLARMDPLTFILLLPFLPFYILFSFFGQAQPRRRLAVTEIERTPTGGWRIFEYEK